MSFNTAPRVTENLFLNTLKFEFPAEPVTFYFSDTDMANAHFTYLKSSKLFPVGISSIFPNLKNSDTLYTSFKKQVNGAKTLEVDFNDPENFHLVKRYYNEKIQRFFITRNFLADSTFIGDTQVWVKDKKAKEITIFDRYTLKINFNHFLQTPELVLSYDRQAKVLNKSVAQFINEYNAQSGDIFDEPDNADNPANLINKVIQVKFFDNDKKKANIKLRRYTKLCKLNKQGEQIDYNSVYPVINNPLAFYLGISIDDGDTGYYAKKNRYTKYIPKITAFRNCYLLNDDFRRIIPIADDFTHIEAGKVKSESKQLVFGLDEATGKHKIDLIPQRGINSGPYSQPRHSNVQLFFIVPQMHRDQAEPLLNMLRDGYGQGWAKFENLQKYLGIPFSTAKGFSLVIQNAQNPLPEIENKLEQRRSIISQNPNTKYLAIYLSPVGKDCKDHSQLTTYYHVKELLLKWGISSQFIDTNKMLQTLNADKQKNKSNFSYSLQNIAIAINAKLGGTPWRIAVPQQRELIVGVGAFKNMETNTQYIGSAFSFDNTGAFNSFEYFQKDELHELAGAIQEAIINYKNVIQNPQRLIIHYYKDMSEREVEVIEDALYKLDVDIPIFVVTINKTESEDIIVYDDGFVDKMPYSGRFVNLGNNQYLLCNNTRYEDNIKSNIEGFPFPVKLKINCPTDSFLLNQNTIVELIEQVYQFSRIYWKSVRQQNLPVTIKYPEMVAQIAPYFTNGCIPSNIGKDNLWFL